MRWCYPRLLFALVSLARFGALDAEAAPDRVTRESVTVEGAGTNGIDAMPPLGESSNRPIDRSRHPAGFTVSKNWQGELDDAVLRAPVL